MSGGSKILVVEDEALIAMELEERLVEMGYRVIGPAATPEDALAAAAADRPDAALLDGNLAGRSSLELAVSLAAQGVRIAFCTGYDSIKNLPPQLANAPVLVKPISDAQLSAALKTLLS